MLGLSQQHDPLIGKVIRNYHFIKELGAGGFGAVYLARYLHPELRNQYVAAKFIDIRDQRSAEDVEREIAIMQRMTHPNIVKIRDTFLFDNAPTNDSGHRPRFIMMDIVWGGSLHSLLRKLDKRLLSYPLILSIIDQVALALDYVHQQGILHLDLKPANILMEPVSRIDPPRFILTDFGIAQFTRPDEQLSKWGGTPAYMSPEHFGLVMDAEQKRVAAPDHRSDIYSLGIILYQLVVGRLPFEGQIHELAQKHRYEAVPLPSRTLSDVPPDIERVILRALEKLPQDRYQSVFEFRQALGDVYLSTVTGVGERIGDRDVGQVVDEITTRPPTLDEAELFTPAPHKAPAAEPYGFKLLILDPDGSEHEKHFSHTPIIVGRAKNADLVLDYAWISSRHVQLDAATETSLRVTDLGSKNGTDLEGTKLLPNQPVDYKTEQWLTMGGCSMQLLEVNFGSAAGVIPPASSPTPASPPPVYAASPSWLASASASPHSYNLTQAAPSDLDLDQVVSQLQAQIKHPRISVRAAPEVLPVRVSRAELVAVYVTPENISHPAIYSLRVSPGPGIDASWVVAAKPKLIHPGETAVFEMTLTVPQGARRGNYPLSLGLSADHPDIPEAVQIVQVQVLRHVDFRVALNPNQVNHRPLFGRRTTLTITNNGSDQETFAIDMEAPEVLRFSVESPQITVEAGESRKIPIQLKSGRSAVPHLSYKINVSTPGSEPKSVFGSYVVLHRPSLLARLLRSLLLAVFIAIVLVIVDRIFLAGGLILEVQRLWTQWLSGL